MPRTGQRLAIAGAVIASIIGYLSYAHNLGDMAQAGRVRSLGATTKIAHVIVCILDVYLMSFYLLLI